MSTDEKKYSYPCDDEDDGISADNAGGTAASYPCDEEEKHEVKGKGRRGGNAAYSKVVHSGVFERKGKKKTAESTKEQTLRSERGSYRDRSGYKESGSGRNRSDSRFRDFSSGKNGRGSARPKSPESVFAKAYIVKVVSNSEVGAFVSAPREVLENFGGKKTSETGNVLLPFKEQVGRPAAGEEVSVHFYEDKGGRLTCTMRTPYLNEGEIGILTVAASTKIGVFLDNGVPKQVLLPFKEQIHTPEVGDDVLVWLYADKSGRQAATMRVYQHLSKESPYKEDDRVTGFVYEINPRLGIFVAVDNKYYGLVPISETFKTYEYGDEIEARVARVRDDGKLDLLIRDKLYKTVEEDSEVILYELRRRGGFLPYGDRADAAFIEETYAMSKNQFKRALGHLYRNRIVELDRENDTVTLIDSKANSKTTDQAAE